MRASLKKWGGGRRISGFKALIALELFLLTACLLSYLIPLRQYIYADEGEVTGEFCCYTAYGEQSRKGCYLDEGLIPEGEEDAELLYMTTPYVDLRGGSYDISITYSTDHPDTKYAFDSKYRTWPVITGHDGIRVPTGDNTLHISLFSPIRVQGFQVHMNYAGSGYLFVERISIRETNAWKNTFLFCVIFISLAMDGVILRYRRLSEEHRREARISLVTIGALTVFAGVPLFAYYVPEGVDLLFHLNRIEAIRESFLAGQIPNRVSPYWNEGYGYAAGVFYGEVFLYVPALLRILGFTVQGAYKCYVMLINLATAWIAYVCFKKAFQNNTAALVGSIAYTLAPARLVCLYLRAAVGEYTAMTFFPLVFYGLFLIYEKDTKEKNYKYSYIALMLGFTGLLQSHTISTMIAVMFTALLCLTCFKKTLHRARFGQLVRAVGGTVLLNLWFLLPFADYFLMGYTNTVNDTTQKGRFSANGTLLSQMFTLFQDGMGFAPAIYNGGSRAEERNLALGAFLLTGFLYVFYRAYRGKEKSTVTRAGDYSLVFAILGTLMCTAWFPWDLIQQAGGPIGRILCDLQFPWRYLGIACFFFAVVTVCMILLVKAVGNQSLYCAVMVLVCSWVVISADYYLHEYLENARECWWFADADRLDASEIGFAEYLPSDTPENFSEDTALHLGEGIIVSEESFEKGVHRVSCINDADADSYLDFPLIPYKGYVCRDEESGEKLSVQLDIPGRLRVILPGGYDGTLRVRFEEPWYWRAAEIVSLVSAVGGAVMLGVGRKKERDA